MSADVDYKVHPSSCFGEQVNDSLKLNLQACANWVCILYLDFSLPWLWSTLKILYISCTPTACCAGVDLNIAVINTHICKYKHMDDYMHQVCRKACIIHTSTWSPYSIINVTKWTQTNTMIFEWSYSLKTKCSAAKWDTNRLSTQDCIIMYF